MTDTIAKLLQTRKKSEQIERIQGLINIADLPGVAITVLFSHGQVRYTVVGTNNINSKQAKALLQTAIEELTRREVLEEVSKAGPPDADPAEIREQLQDFADENPDEQVFDGEPPASTP